jgi:hypothetical protein
MLAQMLDEDEGLGKVDWSGVINQSFDFGKTFLGAKYGKDAAKYQAQPAGQPTPAGGTDAAINASAGGSGFHIGQTFVPWSYVIVGGLGFFLLQSSGFARKGK